MKLEGVLPFARNLLEKAVGAGGAVVDATMGNGHDTLFLARLVGKNGAVFAFDVQPEALEATRERLSEHDALNQASLFLAGHEQAAEFIPASYHGKIKGAIFNLGYLPGSDKSVITKPATTIAAVEKLLEMMAPEGIIVLVVYHGHEGGAAERDSLIDYVSRLDQKKAHVLQYQFINQQNHPPFIIAIEKR
ncbi:16S rRNA (cytosine(1402)-N(4))-methyltransferase [Neobacillus notoginsengisoli]|uniref:16S rRNA (Cytosine(1402)-N(4))-methyltransferase n=1 Tax=Neobacillus notoginsengisoli TaxID=1578198 RepID=A0A417YUL4_9BACI|nr:class I SAM-dependent methyltransferase [Neobacillus notoginsengisoli]RHW40818.1 16S rRNA (cytosine(1402)-N(4))-methyltransferase [Neobacillus notoginsengisoli]